MEGRPTRTRVIPMEDPLIDGRIGRNTMQRADPVRALVFLFPLFFCIAWLGFKKIPNTLYFSLIREDGLLESFEAVFFFAGGILAMAAARRLRDSGTGSRVGFFALLGAGMFLAALEEISWGQRFFHIPSPGFFRNHNTQGETTVHNLRFFQNLLPFAYIGAGLAGMLSWLAVRSAGRKIRETVSACVPDWTLALYFVPVFLIYLYIELACNGIGGCIIGRFIQWRDQEPAEFLMAMGLFLFVLKAHRNSQKP
jgi:hypothetical protein